MTEVNVTTASVKSFILPSQAVQEVYSQFMWIKSISKEYIVTFITFVTFAGSALKWPGVSQSI